MEKVPSFVVPAGVVFEIAEDGLTIQHEGDIVLHTTFGRPLKSVVSRGGSVEIHADVHAGTLAAHGSVTVGGSLTAAGVQAGGDVTVGGPASVGTIESGGSVQVGGDAAVKAVHASGDVNIDGGATAEAIQAGGRVRVGGSFANGVIRAADIEMCGPTTARGLQAAGSVRLGAVRISVDAILAAEVHVEPGTSGRAPLVECQNELGPNALKGKFRLADWEETFGDPLPYLAERGLSVPGEPSAPLRLEPVDAPPAPEPPAAPVAHSTPAVPPQAPPSEGEAAAAEAPAAATPATAMEVEIEESEDVSMNSSLPSRPPEHPLHGELTTAVNKIVDCYGDAEVPPAVAHLKERIESRAYDQVRAEITTIWSDLLKFHQKKGLRIQHQVTTTFNTINSLVKKM